MPRTTAITEADVDKLRTERAQLRTRHAAERKAADEKVAAMREAGHEPLNDKASFDEVDQLYRVADETAEELSEVDARIERAMEIVYGPAGEPSADDSGRGDRAATGPRQVSMGTLASRVLKSDAYADLRSSGALRSDKATVSMDPVQIADREEFIASFLYRAATVDGDPLVPEDQRLIPPVGIPQRDPMVVDLITVGTTDSDEVEYAEQTVRTNNAGGRAFGTDLPENAYTWVRRTVNARRRGAHVTATRGNLADQGQFRTILENQLDEDVRLELEQQIVTGDGVGENFEGILNRSGIGTYARTTGEGRFDALHKGLTVVRLARRRDPSALLTHPNDHEETVLEKDSNGNYKLGSPTESDRKTIWGKTAVPSDVITENTALWGYFPDATLWVREGISVLAFNQHSDYALKGLVLIVAEHRAAFKAVQARGFATVTNI